jgi:hypothetical protein
MTTAEAAAHLGCTARTICEYCRALDVPKVPVVVYEWERLVYDISEQDLERIAADMKRRLQSLSETRRRTMQRVNKALGRRFV